jgi:hypothetical protein
VFTERITTRSGTSCRFAIYATNKEAGRDTPGINNVLKRAWNRLLNRLQRLRNALNGLGYQTSQDIFERARTGAIRQRGERTNPVSKPTSFSAEKGADGKDQLVIPGAERMSDREIARRKALAVKQASKPQKGTEGLPLFGDSKDQGEMFSAVPRSEAEKTVLARIVPSEKGSRWKDFSFGRLYTAIKDDLDPIKQLTADLADGRELSTRDDPYKLARLTRGSFGKAEQFIKYGTFDFDSLRNTGKSLKEVLKPVKNDLDGLRAYAVAKRTLELHDRGIRTGVPIDEAQRTVTEGASDYQQVFDDLVTYQRSLTGYLHDSGILSDEGYAAMLAANKDYVPFFRMMGEKSELGKGLTPGGLKVRDPVRGIRGSERQIIDPIETIIKNTFLFVSLAERNRALTRLPISPTAEPAATICCPRSSQACIRSKSASRRLPASCHSRGRRSGRSRQHDDLPGQHLPPVADRDCAVPQWQAGGPHGIPGGGGGGQRARSRGPQHRRRGFWQFRPVGCAPARCSRPSSSPATRCATSSTPSSTPRTAMCRCTIRCGAWERSQPRTRTTSDGSSRARRAPPSSASTATTSTRTLIRWTTGRDDRLKHVIKSPLEALRVVSEPWRTPPASAILHARRREGNDDFDRCLRSRESTLDFARRGAQTRAVNAMIPFWNAQVEGNDRMVRAFKERPVATTLKATIAITLPSVLLWFLNHDDDRWKELPRWQRDLFWIILTDKWEPYRVKGEDGHLRQATDADMGAKSKLTYFRKVDGQWQINNGTVWRIPKPFEMGIVFGSVPERMLDAYYAQRPNAFKDLGKTIIGGLTPNWIPQAALPMLEQMTNRSFFLERPLVPKYLDNLKPRFQATPSTSETAKKVGGLISKLSDETTFASPIVLDNYVRQWTGGLGQRALNLSDELLVATGMAEAKTPPQKTLADLPVLRAFISRHPERGPEAIEDFYDELGKREKASATVKFLAKSGRAGEAAEEGTPPALTAVRTLRDRLSDQRKIIRGIYNNDKMTAEEKRVLIENSYIQMLVLARQGNDILHKTERKPQAAATD